MATTGKINFVFLNNKDNRHILQIVLKRDANPEQVSKLLDKRMIAKALASTHPELREISMCFTEKDSLALFPDFHEEEFDWEYTIYDKHRNIFNPFEAAVRVDVRCLASSFTNSKIPNPCAEGLELKYLPFAECLDDSFPGARSASDLLAEYVSYMHSEGELDGNEILNHLEVCRDQFWS